MTGVLPERLDIIAYVYDGTAQVELPEDPKYHFTTDMTNQAVSWMKFQKALRPNKRFFIYFAPGAAHAPHHVPAEWRDKYKGKFDQGWDKVRAETLERQKKFGIVPASTTLGPKPKEIKDWDSLSADEKKLFTRPMEIYAGFAEHTDNESRATQRDHQAVLIQPSPGSKSASSAAVRFANSASDFGVRR